jgi:type I restriction enzyme S subunit
MRQHKFKETEIGLIPEDWEVKKLDAIKSLEPKAIAMGPFGSNIRKENYKKIGVPVIRGFNLNAERFLDEDFVFLSEEKAKELSGSSAFPEDIIFVAQGGVGQVGIIPNDAKYERYILSQNLMKISCNEGKADPFFVFYFFRSQRGQDEILSYVNPTGVPCISQPLTSLKLFRIPCPNLSEQREIGKLLSSLDKKIELNKKINLNLEKIGRALFKHWFTDFDFPNEKGKPYKSSGGKMVDSELGEIPKGWKVDSILACADILSGGTPKTSVHEFWGGNIKWVSAKDVTSANGTYILDTGRKITKPGVESSNAKLLPPNTTVITARGTVGNYCLLAESMTINQTNYGIKGKEEYTDIFIFLTMGNLIQILKQHSYGTVFDTITTKNLEEMRIVIPPVDILKSFNDCLSPIMGRMKFNLNECRTLRSLRDSLLQRLMSGQIRV